MSINQNNTVKILTRLTFILIICSSISLAQRRSSNAPFISLFAGDLAIISENITKYYDSRNDVSYGIGLGVPLSRSLTFDVSASYYEKESQFSLNNLDEPDAEALLRQIILNAGFQINLLPNKIIGLSFFFGGNYAFVDEERRDNQGSLVYQLEDKGNLGVYGGANFEISLGKKPIALFGDLKYTYSWKPVLEFEDTYREIKYTGGIKIYLANRWN